MSRLLRILPSLLVVALVIVAACSKSGNLKDTPPEVKFYQLKSALILYDYSGAATGTRKHYIANFGMYQNMADDVVFSMNGKQSHIQTMNITCDTVSYVVDLAKKEAVKSRTEFDMLKQFVKTWTPKQRDNFQLEYLVRNGGEILAKEKLLGKECDVVELKMMGMKHWIWKGVTLKSEFQMGESKMTITAKSIDEGYSPEQQQFEPPKGMTVKDQSSMPRQHPPTGNPH
jgi:hypothetical protein